MVNQLTQYSQLDELAAMNEKLDALTESMNAMTNTNGLDYLGKEVEAAGYDISKSGDDVTELYFELDEYAESLVCNIYDNNGAIVDSVNFTQVDAGKHSFTWDGTDFNGNTQDDGTYIASCPPPIATATPPTFPHPPQEPSPASTTPTKVSSSPSTMAAL